MRALTVVPNQAGSAAVGDIAEPDESEGSVLVETLLVGVCGTDEEIVAGDYGWAPPGAERLVLGHESLGKVLEAPAGSGLKAGDHAVGIVRRPDPVPCYACAAGEWDACRNGQYTEHGIKELNGFMRERYRAAPDAIVAIPGSLGDLGVLLEPTTVVAKVWQQIDAVGTRSTWEPHKALVVGAGPIGLLAALLAKQRGFEVEVVDRVTSGVKPDLVEALGATYHTGDLGSGMKDPDVVVECTGVAKLIFDSVNVVGNGGVVALAGIGPASMPYSFDAGPLTRSMVLANKVLLGSVNANRAHYEAGAEALAKADRGWLGRLVSRRVPLEDFHHALERSDADVKVVVEIGS